MRNVFTRYANSHINLFPDEVDGFFAGKANQESDGNTRVKNMFLTRLDGINKLKKGVVLVAASNVPHKLDVSFRSRFDIEIVVPLPNCEQRKQLLTARMLHMEHELTASDVKAVAKATEG